REEDVGRVCVRTRRHGVARGTAEGALVRCVAVRLYEKRREAAAAWLQPLIVAEEESASEWSRQLVERAGDVILFQESSVTGREVADPVVRRQDGRLALFQVSVVVIGHREAVADTQQLAGVRVVHTETVEWRDYLRSGPGHASIRRLHKRYGLGGACSPEGRVGRRDQVCEVVERVGLGAGVDEDDIADRL